MVVEYSLCVSWGPGRKLGNLNRISQRDILQQCVQMVEKWQGIIQNDWKEEFPESRERDLYGEGCLTKVLTFSLETEPACSDTAERELDEWILTSIFSSLWYPVYSNELFSLENPTGCLNGGSVLMWKSIEVSLPSTQRGRVHSEFGWG